MPGYLTKVEVADPHLIGQSVWENLPQSEKALLDERAFCSSEWDALDQRRLRLEPEGYRTRYSLANIGALSLSHIADNCAIQFRITLPIGDAVCFSMFERGAGRFVLPGSGEPTIGNPATGVIRDSETGTSVAASDGNSRILLFVPAGLLRRRLGALLDHQNVETVTFQSEFDQMRGTGATIRRMLGFLFAELEHSDSLLTNEIAARRFEENLVSCLLLGLGHNYSDALHGQKPVAAPRNVRRAEEFLRANATEAITIEQIADAAACSIRSLFLAFRRFRNTTPMATLRRIRLEQAHKELIQSDGSQSVIAVAAKYGFANPGRFANQYKRTFGAYPSEALRARALRL